MHSTGRCVVGGVNTMVAVSGYHGWVHGVVRHGREKRDPTSYPYCWAFTLKWLVTPELSTIVLVAVSGVSKGL